MIRNRGRLLVGAAAVLVVTVAARRKATTAPGHPRPASEPLVLSKHSGWPRAPRKPSIMSLRRAVFALMVVLLLLVPWSVPGFAHRVGGFLGADSQRQPVKVADPEPRAPSAPVLSSAPSGYLTGVLRSVGVPTRLVVPRLRIDAPIVPVATTRDTLTPPSDPQMLGWWLQGPKVGSGQGTAVITGHTVHTGGGAFDHLDALVVGDTFRVATRSGTITYRVTDVRNYTKGDLANSADSLFSLLGLPQVALVTCANYNGHVYLDNTVVIGQPISET